MILLLIGIFLLIFNFKAFASVSAPFYLLPDIIAYLLIALGAASCRDTAQRFGSVMTFSFIALAASAARTVLAFIPAGKLVLFICDMVLSALMIPVLFQTVKVLDDFEDARDEKFGYSAASAALKIFLGVMIVSLSALSIPIFFTVCSVLRTVTAALLFFLILRSFKKASLL